MIENTEPDRLDEFTSLMKKLYGPSTTVATALATALHALKNAQRIRPTCPFIHAAEQSTMTALVNLTINASETNDIIQEVFRLAARGRPDQSKN